MYYRRRNLANRLIPCPMVVQSERDGRPHLMALPVGDDCFHLTALPVGDDHLHLTTIPEVLCVRHPEALAG